MRILAVDWSGRATGAAETIWVAETVDGVLTDLRNGYTREEVVEELVGRAGDDPETVVGLDFCFSCPRWWCEEQGWSEAPAVWLGMRERGEELLAACEPPFWGRAGKPRPTVAGSGWRKTELEDVGGTAKSVFQVGGAGAVGTGSIRGMPHLLTLASRGFHVWPFSDGWPRVLEIYPRAFTGPVAKSRWRSRHDHLLGRFAAQPEALLERAAGSEDAFDAAASALAMSEHEDQLRSLDLPADPIFAIEGKIWVPRSGPRRR